MGPASETPHPPATPATHPTAAPISAGRAAVVLAAIGLVLLGLVARVAYLQTVFAGEAGERAVRQHAGTTPLHARRGSIFDRNGLMLAGSVQGTALFADPKFMHERFLARGQSLFDLDQAVEHVADVVGADPDDVAVRVGRDVNRRYVRLARGLSDEMVGSLREMNVPGLGFEPEPRRYYPMGQIAAHVLGTVGWEETGLEGVERLHQDALAGTPGAVRTVRDKRRRPVASSASAYQSPEHGVHLVLTLDANIQYAVEQELARVVREFGAASASAVVMDPHTGEILALANYPTYFPQYLADSTPDARRNRVATDPYEPGSVVKPFIVAGLIDRGICTVDEVIDTEPTRMYRTAYGRRITDVHNYEHLAVWDVLVKSSNIGMAKLGQRVDKGQMRQILADFGFGQATDSGVAGEHRGMLLPVARWTTYSRESVVQGYEMLATPLQLARATAVLANGGRTVTPRLVAGRLGPDGTFEADVRADASVEVLAPDTARAVRRVLADVHVRGTARRAASERWNLFGKTGTAHRSVDGRYDETHYTASYVGGGPYEDPRVVVAVCVTDPDKSKSHFGGIVAAPAGRLILESALDVLGVSDSPDLPPYPPTVASVLHNAPAAD